MGYLKSAVETSLFYAEQAKIPDYVSAIRMKWKPADSMVAQVESLVSAHGAPLVNKLDQKLDPVADAAFEKYGMYKEKCTDMIEYAQTKKEGVVTYTNEKKELVVTKVKASTKTVSDAKEEIVRQVKTGEIETTILKKSEFSPMASWLAKTIIGYKGMLKVKATTITAQIQTKSAKQMDAIKVFAKELEGKLPIVEIKAKVAEITVVVTAKSSPYVDMVMPYYLKAKTEFKDAKSKVYSKFMDIKSAYLVKKTA
jgi:hypothetical protein